MAPATGTTPLLNEPYLLAILKNETLPMTSDGMLEFCSVLVLACVDRKVTREYLMEFQDVCNAMHSHLGDVECGMRLIDALKSVDKAYDTKDLDESMREHGKVFTQKRRLLAEMFTKLTECPTADDKIN